MPVRKSIIDIESSLHSLASEMKTRHSDRTKRCPRPELSRRVILLLLCMLLHTSKSFLWNTYPSRFRRSIQTTARRMSEPSATTTTPPKKKNLVVVIAGPTAAGKSAVAALICAKERGIIVSADSVQVYRGVQIGANKPTDEERKETPHILVDVADHTENYNAAEWRRDAVSTIHELLSQNDKEEVTDTNNNPCTANILKEVRKARLEKGYATDDPLLPVICGGTMMYIQWLVHGQPDAMRPSQKAVEQAEETMAKFQENNDFQGALDHVASFGEIFANRNTKLCGEDWYRLRRTLEVGLTVQDQDNKEELIEKLYSGERQGSLASSGFDVRCFFLCPDDRMSHTRIIEERCEQMIMRGLLKETAELTLSGCMPDMAARAIGYRQTLDYLNDDSSDRNEEEVFQTFLNDFSTATRRYSKKQMAWFRKEKDFMFVPVGLKMDKTERIETAAGAIQNYCQMSRDDYENALRDDDSPSAASKKKNEEQGKKMKTFQSKRHILKEGTKELEDAFSQAVEFRERMQSKRRRLEEQTQQ
jgi:tRNA dimethylallyltransferase